MGVGVRDVRGLGSGLGNIRAVGRTKGGGGVELMICE